MALLARWVGPGLVKAQATNTDSIRLKIGTNPAVTTGVVYSAAGTCDADGWAQVSLPALTAGAKYYYRVEMKSGTLLALDTDPVVGEFRYAPTAPTSFGMCFASCADALNPTVFSAIAAHKDDLFLHPGDLYYGDGTGQDLANYKAKLGNAIRASNQQKVYATTTSVYTPSDHDFAMKGNNGTGPGEPLALANFNLAHRQMIAAPRVPATTGVYFTFTWGRVRFFVLDCRSFCSPITTADGPNKTKLGSAQKTWLKNQITNSDAALHVLLGDVPWTGPKTSGDDEWASFDTERQELGAFFEASGKNFTYIAGDMHALAYHNGTTAEVAGTQVARPTAGGIQVFQGGPLSNNASHKAKPYTALYPATEGTAIIQQYGRILVTDTGGSSIRLGFKGYSADGTERMSYNHTYPVGGGVVTYDVTVSPVSAVVGVDSATLNWGLGGPDASNITGWYVGRTEGSMTTPWESALLPAATRSLQFPGLAAGTYQLHAEAVVGTTRVARGVTTVTVKTATALDVVLTATTTMDVVAGTATLTWVLSGADAAQVTGFYASRTGWEDQPPYTSAILPPAQRSLTFTRMRPGATYVLSVDALVGSSSEATAETSVTLEATTTLWETIYDGSATAHSDVGLTSNTAYQYRYAAANSDGISEWSPVTDAVTADDSIVAPANPATAPTSSSVTSGGAVLTMPEVPTATSYVLQRSTVIGSGYVNVYTGTNRVFNDSNLNASTTYYYRYRGSNVAGPSVGWSPVRTVTTSGVVVGTAQPMSAKEAISYIGVVTHQNFGAPKGLAVYQETAAVAQWVAHFNYRRMRSNLSTQLASSKEYVEFCRAQGIKWNVPVFSANGSTTDAEAIAKMKWVATNAADVVGGFEGLNEPSHYYTGGTTTTAQWMDVALHYQELIWNTRNSLPALAGVPVLSSAMHQAEAEDALKIGQNWWEMLAARGFTEFFDVSALHTYGGNKGHPETFVEERVARIKAAWPGKPVWVTETGYSDAWGQTPTEAHGLAYGGRLALGYARRRVPFYNYELLDDTPTAQVGTQRVYGVVSTGTTDAAAMNPANWKAKGVGRGLKAVTDTWVEPSTVGNYTPVRVKCDISTTATNVISSLFARKAQSDAGTATLWLYRMANMGALPVEVIVTDRVGPRSFQVDASITRVDLR